MVWGGAVQHRRAAAGRGGNRRGGTSWRLGGAKASVLLSSDITCVVSGFTVRARGTKPTPWQGSVVWLQLYQLSAVGCWLPVVQQLADQYRQLGLESCSLASPAGGLKGLFAPPPVALSVPPPGGGHCRQQQPASAAERELEGRHFLGAEYRS